jgi:hypothetical protein
MGLGGRGGINPMSAPFRLLCGALSGKIKQNCEPQPGSDAALSVPPSTPVTLGHPQNDFRAKCLFGGAAIFKKWVSHTSSWHKA